MDEKTESKNEDSSGEQNKTEGPPETKEIPKINFSCSNCGMNEMCHYFGKEPPFARKIRFAEDSYLMMDPFSPPPDKHSNHSNSEYVLALGAHCAICGQIVCKGIECSFYYSKTFCLSCANSQIKEFPLEIQRKIKKQISNVSNIS